MSNHLMSSFDVAVLQCNSRKCCNQTEIPASLLFWIENYVWCSDYINEKLKLNIQISQDSVVTHLRRGGGFPASSAVHLWMQKWKNYYNRSTLTKLSSEEKLRLFMDGPHCILFQPHTSY